MTLRLTASATVRAAPGAGLGRADGLGRPAALDPVHHRPGGGPVTGIGVRADALSGFWLGRVPIGLLDRFVVTDWTPPGDDPGRLEVLHLGPVLHRVRARSP